MVVLADSCSLGLYANTRREERDGIERKLNYYHVVFKRQLTIGIAKLHELLNQIYCAQLLISELARQIKYKDFI